MARCAKRSLMQDSSETLVYTVKIDIWMIVENVKILVIAEKLYIYIYIYIYIYYPFSLLIFLLNNYIIP